MQCLVIATLIAATSLGAAAAPVTYRIDPDHTYPSFEADHMGISVWRGKMTKVKGEVVLDRAAGTGSVDITIDPASIDTGLKTLDNWARGIQFLDVRRFGSATYKGRLEGFNAGVPSQVVGELTLHGITKPVVLKINAFKCVPHPLLRRELCGADAQGSFSRDEFGLEMGKEYGFKMDVNLRIQVEALAAS